MPKQNAEGFTLYDAPNDSLFISIVVHNSEIRILNSEICTSNFGIRNCEVYIVTAHVEDILNLLKQKAARLKLIDLCFIFPSSVLI